MACLDGPVGDRLSELPDEARQGPAFESTCQAVAVLAAAGLRYMGGAAPVVRCVRRLVAALLPAGEEEDEEGEEEGEEKGEEGVEEEEEGGEEMEEQEGEGEAEEAEAEEEEEAAMGEPGKECPSSDADTDMEPEGNGDESDADEDALMGAEEEEVPEPAAVPRVSGGLAGGPGGPGVPEGRDFTSELHQPALPLLPSLPCAAAAAAASFMLQQLVGHPLFSGLQASTSAEGGSSGSRSFSAPLPPFAARLATPLPSVLDLVVPPHPLAADLAPAQQWRQRLASSAGGTPTGNTSPDGTPSLAQAQQSSCPEQLSTTGGSAASPFLSSAAAGPPLSSAAAAGSLDLELLLLLESLLDMRRAFDATAPSEGGMAAASPFSTWPGASGSSEDATSLGALLRLLQCSYGATLSSEDRACLRIMFTLDALLQGKQALGGSLGRAGGQENNVQLGSASRPVWRLSRNLTNTGLSCRWRGSRL